MCTRRCTGCRASWRGARPRSGPSAGDASHAPLLTMAASGVPLFLPPAAYRLPLHLHADGGRLTGPAHAAHRSRPPRSTPMETRRSRTYIAFDCQASAAALSALGRCAGKPAKRYGGGLQLALRRAHTVQGGSGKHLGMHAGDHPLLPPPPPPAECRRRRHRAPCSRAWG